ncbi:MAG: O-antigen ligase family protein [Candidatus Paceibacterota bacterium]
MNRTSTFLYGACQLLIAIILVAIPFVIDPSLVYPIALKGVVLRVLVAVLFVLWAAWLISDRRIRVAVSPVTYLVVVFLAVLGVTSFLGVDLYESIWGSLVRVEGFLTLLALGLFAFISSNILRQKREWARVITVSVVVSSILASVALLQFAGVIDRISPGSNPSATLGNSLYLSGYLLLNLFLVFWLWSLRTSSYLRDGIFVLLLSLYVSALFITAAKGSHLALLVGMFVSALGLISSSRTLCWPLVTRRTVSVGAVSVALALGSIASIYYFTPAQAPWRVLSPTDEYFTRTDVETSYIARYELWKLAWKGIEERPLIGWGLESFDQVYERHYTLSVGVSRHDRPHNSVLRWWVEGGAFALLFFLMLFSGAVFALWRKEKEDPRCIHAIDVPIFAGFMGAYFVQSLTSYDDISRLLMFFLALGYIMTQTGRQVRTTAPAKYLIMLVGLTIIAVLAPFHIDSVRTLYSLASVDDIVRVEGPGPVVCADVSLVPWKRYSKDCDDVVSLYDRYQELLAYEGFSSIEVAREIVRTARHLEKEEGVSDDVRRQYRELARRAIREQLARQPFDSVLRAQALEFYREAQMSDEADEMYRSLLEYAPGRAAGYRR